MGQHKNVVRSDRIGVLLSEAGRQSWHQSQAYVLMALAEQWGPDALTDARPEELLMFGYIQGVARTVMAVTAGEARFELTGRRRPGRTRKEHQMDWDIYKGLAEEYQQEKAERRAAATDEFERARKLALPHGLVLCRNTEAHYTLGLSSDGSWVWLWDVYPGRRRLKIRRQHPRTPWLDLPFDWRLMDVVAAAIRYKQECPSQAAGERES